MRRAHPEQDEDKASNATAVSTTPQKPRAKIACDTCRKRKLRCSGELPCGQCQASNHSCTFSPRSARRPAARPPNEDMEMLMQDPTATNAPEPSRRASVNVEGQRSGLHQQPQTSSLDQIAQPDSMNAWAANEEALPSSLDHFRPSRDLFDSQRGMDLIQPEPLQADELSFGDIEGFDSFWPSGDFVSSNRYPLNLKVAHSRILGFKFLARRNGLQFYR